MKNLKTVLVLIKKDFLLELRTKEIALPYLLFSFLLLFLLAFGIEKQEALPLFSFLYFLSFIFSGIIGLSRIAFQEVETEAVYTLLTLPIQRHLIFIGKVSSVFIFMVISGIVLMVIFSVFLNIPFPPFLEFLLILSLFSFGFSVLGILLAFMSAKAVVKEFLLPILLIPLFVPPFIAGTKGLSSLLQDKVFNINYIFFLIFFDVLYFLIADLLFEYIIIE